MPPKKKKAAKQTDANDLLLTEKLQKANIEINALQRELENTNEINARLRQTIIDLKIEKNHQEEQIELREQDRLDLTANMARQYKTMQGDLISEINRLESSNSELQNKLSQLHAALADGKKSFEDELRQKDATIEDLQMKISYMTKEFENMLNETLNKIISKLELASQKWKENDKIELSENNMRRLEDFQLTRLALGK